MNNKIITLMAVLLGFSLVSFAQESGGYGPSQGSLTVSLNYGNQAFHSPTMITSFYLPNSESTDFEPGDVYKTLITGIDERMSKMAGIRIGYAVTDQIKARLSGSYMFANVAPQEDIPGLSGEPGANVPTILPVDSELTSSFFVELGGEYHFNFGRVSAYSGLAYTYGYTLRRQEMVPASMMPVSGEPEFPDAGPRQASLISHSLAAIVGLDYYLTDRFYVGLESKFGNYIYSVSNIVAGPGMESGKAQMSDFSLLSQPQFKVGFVIF